MAGKKGKRAAIALYLLLLVIMLTIMALHLFGLYELKTDFFARYVIALVFALMLLPLVPRIKLFDIIDVKRETRMFAANAKRKK